MNPVDPSELSALLDGELDAQRAEEVRRAMAGDSALRDEYERIAALDAEWKARARAAMFRPQIASQASVAPRFPLVALVAGAALLRVVLKLAPAAFATSLEIAVLVFLIGWTLRRLLAASQVECCALARQMDSSA